MHREHCQDMIWLETSPAATRLQVAFRSNKKKQQQKKTKKSQMQKSE